MLRFIYEKQILSKSKLCFIWCQFKKVHEVDKTVEELKYIFNCTILPNIIDYDQIDEDQKRYFKLVEVLSIDETEKILMNNEPQVGLDYKLIRENDGDSTDSELDDTNLEMLIKEKLENSKKYHGKFEEDLPGENDDYVLKIKVTSPDEEYVEQDGEMEHELAVIFSALLTTDEEREKDVKLLSQEQIFSRLQTNRDLFARSSNYFTDSSDVTVKQEPAQSELARYSDNHNSGIDRNIPANSTLSTDSELLTPQDNPANCSSSSEPEPITPQDIPAICSSSSGSESLNTLEFQTSTPYIAQPSTSKATEPSTYFYAVPRIKTKAALVPNPVYYPRMETFVERFISKKRPRRTTVSPPSSD